MAVRFTPGGLQSYDPFQGASRGGGGGSSEPQKSTTQINCEAKGGKWNSSTQRCVMPESITKARAEEKAKSSTPETFTDPRTGRASGITLPDGRTFLGLGPEDVSSIAAGEAARVARPEGTAPVGTFAKEQAILKQQQEFEATGSPVRRELDPVLGVGEGIPVVGPFIVLLADKVRDLLNTPAMKKIIGDSPFGESFELSPEELKTVALTMIEKREIERGLTDSEKFGRLIEAIPGGDLEKYIPGASEAELPSGNVQTALKSLRILKSRAIDVELKYNKGLIKTRSAANARLDQIENEIQEGESRMKMLLQGSPEFKFNSDGVNFIELKILEARERVFDSRMAVMGGPNLDPNEVDILLELQEDVQIEDFDIPGL